MKKYPDFAVSYTDKGTRIECRLSTEYYCGTRIGAKGVGKGVTDKGRLEAYRAAHRDLINAIDVHGVRCRKRHDPSRRA